MSRSLGLLVSGDLRLTGWQQPVTAALGERLSGNARTAEKVLAETARLFAYLRACGAECWDQVTAEMVLGWCWAARRSRGGGSHRAAAQSTARNRQWAARLALREAESLGAPIIADALAGERVPRPTDSTATRPLTVAEAERVRAVIDAEAATSRRLVMVALSFAGASASECAGVLRRDVDIYRRSVVLRGDSARVAPLDGWGARTVERYLLNTPVVPSGERLCVKAQTSPQRAAQSVNVRLGQVIAQAGLAGLAGVSARSLRLHTARGVLDTDGIEAAARLLGSPSLDTAAAALGYRWRRGGG